MTASHPQYFIVIDSISPHSNSQLLTAIHCDEPNTGFEPRLISAHFFCPLVWLAVTQFLWRAVETMPAPKDYLQVFVLCIQNGIQVVHHSAEQPMFNMTYVLPNISEPVSAKIYIIDDYYADENQHIATMLLAEEY